MTKFHKQAVLTADAQKPAWSVDRLIYIAAIIEPLILYPQAIQIFRYENAQGISIPTWIGINILTSIWIWYAITRKQKVIFLYQGLFFIANTLIIIGALMYGGKWF